MFLRTLLSHKRRYVLNAQQRTGMIRLKLYLALDEQTLQFCRSVNAGIRRLTDSAIVFGDDSPMIPHITLATGFLVHPHTLEGLADVAKSLAQRVQPLTLRLGQPYLNPVQRGYVLCDIGEHPDFLTLRKLVSETTPGAFLPMRKIGSHRAHLTLAHIDAHHDTVHSYLQSVKEIPRAVCTRMEIAHVGHHGTCIDRLFGCDLARGNDRTEELRAHQLSYVDMYW
jgi:2'-5' RNA ligase